MSLHTCGDKRDSRVHSTAPPPVTRLMTTPMLIIMVIYTILPAVRESPGNRGFAGTPRPKMKGASRINPIDVGYLTPTLQTLNQQLLAARPTKSRNRRGSQTYLSATQLTAQTRFPGPVVPGTSPQSQSYASQMLPVHAKEVLRRTMRR